MALGFLIIGALPHVINNAAVPAHQGYFLGDQWYPGSQSPAALVAPHVYSMAAQTNDKVSRSQNKGEIKPLYNPYQYQQQQYPYYYPQQQQAMISPGGMYY
jgi:hypothetical protein